MTAGGPGGPYPGGPYGGGPPSPAYSAGIQAPGGSPTTYFPGAPFPPGFRPAPPPAALPPQRAYPTWVPIAAGVALIAAVAFGVARMLSGSDGLVTPDRLAGFTRLDDENVERVTTFAADEIERQGGGRPVVAAYGSTSAQPTVLLLARPTTGQGDPARLFEAALDGLNRTSGSIGMQGGQQVAVPGKANVYCVAVAPQVAIGCGWAGPRTDGFVLVYRATDVSAAAVIAAEARDRVEGG